uniref:CR-type domain-containing protein n=1 Tax=Rhodosorus marinus TaxID=101924 RepID=A0A7S0G3T3_9RHOD|mmetsp:Transcript_19205/g.27836  ORF Transcript_19205/g.27836 Transcript_19205/m.27836 type:complete len:198 (+) Transcript_19205:242-835(+)
MEACFVGLASSVRGLRVSNRLAVQSRRRHCYAVACTKTDEDSVTPKIVRDVGLDESWYVYYEEGNKCVVCRGEGTETCSYCYGEGFIVIGANQETDRAVCPICEGAKVTVCMRCNGTGVRPSTRFNAETEEEERNPTNAEILANARKDKLYTENQPSIPEPEPEVVEASDKAVQPASFHDDESTKLEVLAAEESVGV